MTVKVIIKKRNESHFQLYAFFYFLHRKCIFVTFNYHSSVYHCLHFLMEYKRNRDYWIKKSPHYPFILCSYSMFSCLLMFILLLVCSINLFTKCENKEEITRIVTNNHCHINFAEMKLNEHQKSSK